MQNILFLKSYLIVLNEEKHKMKNVELVLF